MAKTLNFTNKIPKKVWVVLGLSMAAFALVSIPLFAYYFNSQPDQQAQAKFAVLNILEGEVKKLNQSTQSFEKVESNQNIYQGDTIKTLENSSAIVFFTNNSTVLLEQNTEVSFDEIPDSQTNRTSIKQIIGETWSKVVKNTGSQYEVKSDTAIAAVRGTSFSMIVDESKNSLVKVTESVVEVAVIKPDQEVKTEVSEGNQVIVEKNKIETYQPENFDQVVQPLRVTGSVEAGQCLDNVINEAINLRQANRSFNNVNDAINTAEAKACVEQTKQRVQSPANIITEDVEQAEESVNQESKPNQGQKNNRSQNQDDNSTIEDDKPGRGLGGNNNPGSIPSRSNGNNGNGNGNGNGNNNGNGNQKPNSNNPIDPLNPNNRPGNGNGNGNNGNNGNGNGNNNGNGKATKVPPPGKSAQGLLDPLDPVVVIDPSLNLIGVSF